MGLNIDGYQPPSNDVAFDQGVTFEYPTAYGTIEIRSKLASRDNVKYRLAMTQYNDWLQRRRNLTKGKVDTEADERLIGLIHDYLVIDWSTDITSDGEAIRSTRENFIELMQSPATQGVFTLYMQDAADEDQFRAEVSETDRGNSRPPSDGTSDGQQKTKSG